MEITNTLINQLQQYWTIFNLIIIAYILYQLRKVKKKAVEVDQENVTTATHVARAEAHRVASEARCVAEEAKQTAERAAEEVKETARQVAKQLAKGK